MICSEVKEKKDGPEVPVRKKYKNDFAMKMAKEEGKIQEFSRLEI
jgi:hypothetical protein